MSKKQAINLTACTIISIISASTLFTFSEDVTVFLTGLLNNIFDKHSEVLAFKSKAADLIIISRKWAGNPIDGQWVNSVSSYDFFTHLAIPAVLVSFLSVILYQIRKNKLLVSGFFTLNILIVILRMWLPIRNGFATEYMIVDGAAKKASQSFLMENFWKPLQTGIESYGAIGLRLYLPLILFTVAIYPYLKQQKEKLEPINIKK